jgi:3-phosphoshikimate 1-carboxyvinyltransferase
MTHAATCHLPLGDCTLNLGPSLRIEPVLNPIVATVRPPGSKSITNRALVCAALAEGRSILTGALQSDDTRVMIDSLRRMGISVGSDESGETLHVDGCDGRPPAAGGELFVGNSGTTIRFLAAVAALGQGRFRLDGVPRMRERPIGDLLDALGQLGSRARSENDDARPPVVIDAAGLAGGIARVRGDLSSQFLSGLLLAAPRARAEVRLAIVGDLVSRPYIEMTLRVMSAFGAKVDRWTGDGAPGEGFRIAAPRNYSAREYAIEPDASAASYFWAAAAITGGEVAVTGLHRDSLQGDVAFCDVLARMGCEVKYASDQVTVRGGPLVGVEVDMNAISDTVQTLAAVALFAQGPTTITGVGHIRHKETDRIGDLARELRKLGASVDELPDGLRIAPGERRGATIETYHDHRMAMSLALVGLRTPGVEILNPQCVEKTYPRFFADLAAARLSAGNSAS